MYLSVLHLYIMQIREMLLIYNSLLAGMFIMQVTSSVA